MDGVDDEHWSSMVDSRWSESVSAKGMPSSGSLVEEARMQRFRESEAGRIDISVKQCVSEEQMRESEIRLVPEGLRREGERRERAGDGAAICS